MEQNIGQLSDYYAIIRRRKMYIIVPLSIILLITIGLAFGLPPVYQSSATILVEQQEIPQELVRSTVTSYAAERIQVISQSVMTRANLQNIIEKYDLFSKERMSGNTDDLITRMRENINVEMVSAEGVDPSSGKQGKVTIAFTLSFESSVPQDAQNVAEELTTLFMDENIRIRTQKAEVTSDFLSEEANRLSEEISILEDRLAKYKEKNAGKLPELMQMNMTRLDGTERELEGSMQKIASLDDRKMLLESQLIQIEPNTGASPEGRLRKLQSDYLSASAIYATDHPDLVRMRREIEALKKQTGIGNDTAELDGQILKVRAELAAAGESYAPDHPDIIKLQKTLALLEDEFRQKSSDLNIVDIEIKPDNPAYISAMNQLEAVKLEIKAEKERQARLQEKHAFYEDRVTQIPRVEQEGLSLKRDYDNAVKKFHEIKQKQLQAQVGEQLERESKGERFTLIDPPSLPTQPIKPNRPGILLLGTALSMTGGMGLAAITEFLDQTVRGAKAVTGLLKAPPLSMIPYIENSKDRRRKRKRFIMGLSLSALAIFLLLLFISFIWLPMDS